MLLFFCFLFNPKTGHSLSCRPQNFTLYDIANSEKIIFVGELVSRLDKEIWQIDNAVFKIKENLKGLPDNTEIIEIDYKSGSMDFKPRDFKSPKQGENLLILATKVSNERYKYFYKTGCEKFLFEEDDLINYLRQYNSRLIIWSIYFYIKDKAEKFINFIIN